MKHQYLYVSILIILFIFICITSAYNESETFDEPSHYIYGMSFYSNQLTHADMQRMPVTAFNALPSYILNKIGINLSYKNRNLIRRIPSIIISSLLAFCVFFVSRDYYGIKAGLFSLFIYVFCPNIIAHSRLIATDIYCAFLIFIAIYYFLLCLENFSIKSFFLFSIFTGIAQVSKQTSLILYPLFFLVIIIIINKKWYPAKIKKLFIYFIIFSFINLFIINLTYRFNGTFHTLNDSYKVYEQAFNKLNKKPLILKIASTSVFSKIPIPLPSAYTETLLLGSYFNITGDGHPPIYLLGSINQYGWKEYFIIVLLFKLPISIIIFILMRIFFISNRKLLKNINEITLISLIVSVFLFFSLSTAQTGIRYLLPIFPCLFVLFGKIVVQEYQKIKFHRAIIPILLIYLSISTISYYPHFISYFNELIGKRINMYKFLADSNVEYGQDKFYLLGHIAKYKDENIQFYSTKQDSILLINHNKNKYIQINPKELKKGILIISVNKLVGCVFTPNDFVVIKYIKEHFKPIDRIAYSYLVFKINEDNLNELKNNNLNNN